MAIMPAFVLLLLSLHSINLSHYSLGGWAEEEEEEGKNLDMALNMALLPRWRGHYNFWWTFIADISPHLKLVAFSLDVRSVLYHIILCTGVAL